MKTRRTAIVSILLVAVLLLWTGPLYAQSQSNEGVKKTQAQEGMQALGDSGKMSSGQRQLSAFLKKISGLNAASSEQASAVPAPGGTPDYFGIYPNYANSPLPTVVGGNVVPGTGMRKFVDSLPGLGYANRNDLGQYIPVAVPDQSTYTNCDYYEIELGQYTEQMHKDLPVTTLRGYRQTNTSDPNVSKFSYLGPIIIAQKDRPVRVKFTNKLSTGTSGNLFIPVDETVMGAGLGPDGVNKYKQNRATLHLHGGDTPWISDGTMHQWITPSGESTPYPKGVSVRNVPDMPDPGPGSQTFYYTNQQSARLMFYHDHAYGITRLNVYAGEAAGYLLQDSAEKGLVDGNIIPADQLPLIIQDKTFVPDPAQLTAEDPTWDTAKYGGKGNLWFPHVYMPNQNPYDISGSNAMGRWDYGPWFWPPYTGLTNGPVNNPYYDPIAAPWEPPKIPGTPNPSIVPEGFMDTPLVNGTAYPYVKVGPKAYRFRILNASNDRSLNLQLHYAKANATMWDPGTGALLDANAGEINMVPAAPNTGLPATWPTDGRDGGVPDPTKVGPNIIQIGTEGGFLPNVVDLPNTPVGYEYNRRSITVLNVSNKTLMLGPAERADVIVDFSGVPDGSKLILYNDAPAPVPAFDPRNDYYTGGPDQTATGGAPTTQPGYGPNTRTIMQIQVDSATPGGMSGFNLTNLNTALPAAYAQFQPKPIVPSAEYNTAFGASYPVDSYTRIQDTTKSFFNGPLTGLTLTNGGSGYAAAPGVLISGGGGSGAAGSTTIQGGVVKTITLTNPGTGYTSAPTVAISGGGGTGAAATPTGVMMNLQPKAIQELFDPEYGRMNATLGVEIPNTNITNQTTIPYFDIDPTTEIIKNSDAAAPIGTLGDGTQIWKITHNGVDTHAIHWHMFNVQLINRVGWDGMVKPPDPNEVGWKDTVRMNPLEDCIVALRPIIPDNLPFDLPNSIRLLDPTKPIGSMMGFTNVDPTGQPAAVTNREINYGWEYVWHCHLLGHEENIMMRPMSIGVAPKAPSNLVGSAAINSRVILNWKDNSLNETDWTVQRALAVGGPWTDVGKVPSTTGGSTGATVAYTDATVVTGGIYYYRVIANNVVGDTTPYAAPAAGYPSMSVDSAVSNTFNTGAGVLPTITSLSPTSGATGATVTINGSGFGATRATTAYKVFFGTVAATSYTSWSNTQIRVLVPSGAAGLTPVTVVNPVGTSNAKNFGVIPRITNLSPASGPSGTTVTINGNGFGGLAAASHVHIAWSPGGGTTNLGSGVVTSWSNTTIRVRIVIPAGKTRGSITIVTAGGTSNAVTFTKR